MRPERGGGVGLDDLSRTGSAVFFESSWIPVAYGPEPGVVLSVPARVQLGPEFVPWSAARRGALA
jgi:hypothetical protein